MMLIQVRDAEGRTCRDAQPLIHYGTRLPGLPDPCRRAAKMFHFRDNDTGGGGMEMPGGPAL
jgi:hypothetical protein